MTTLNISDQQFCDLLNGGWGLVSLAPESVLTPGERQHLLELTQTLVPTFEYENLPVCWGRAFENYLSMAEYLNTEPNDTTLQVACAPALERISATLRRLGFEPEILHHPDGRPYNVNNLRTSVVEAATSILHIDDLGLDGTVKPDFALPTALQGQPYVQTSLLVCLNETQSEAAIRVYNRRYRPDDEVFRLENGWQFADAAVEGVDYVDIKPQMGDTFLMPNHYFHDVLGGGKDDFWVLYSLYLLHIPGTKRVYLYI
jgi:hypothetical protein